MTLAVSSAVGLAADGSGTPDPYGVPGKWEVAFADEFDADTLDGASWTRCYWWDDNGCTNLSNKELQWYMPANVELTDGYLRLQARPESVVGYKGQMFEYTSGMVTTGRDYEDRKKKDRFSTLYGYFEVRAKIPAGKGLWPAFWLLPSTQKSKPEIDIMETLGHEPGILQMHVHFKDANGDDASKGSKIEADDLSKDFHVYGLEWQQDAIVWYLDGQEQWRFTEKDNISSEPMYMLLNLAVGGNWPGAPDSNTIFPANFTIDYVRVWKRTGK